MKDFFAAREMRSKASEAAALMKALSNRRRLLILCYLIDAGEMSVGTLATKVRLSQSALSQHLARLREQGLVSFRRDAQTLFYRICDDRVEAIVRVLHQMFCGDPEGFRESLMAQPAPTVKGEERGGEFTC